MGGAPHKTLPRKDGGARVGQRDQPPHLQQLEHLGGAVGARTPHGRNREGRSSVRRSDLLTSAGQTDVGGVDHETCSLGDAHFARSPQGKVARFAQGIRRQFAKSARHATVSEKDDIGVRAGMGKPKRALRIDNGAVAPCLPLALTTQSAQGLVLGKPVRGP